MFKKYLLLNIYANLFLMLFVIVSCGASYSVYADEKRPWDIEFSVGAIATSGNTQSTSVQAKIDAKQNLEKWQNEYIFNSLFKQDEVTQDDNTKVKEQTADKYLASIKSAYLMEAEKSYLFGYVSYANDKFGAYRSYTTVAVGYGNWLYLTPTFSWYAELGPGYFQGQQVITDPNSALPDTLIDQKGAIVRASTELKWKMTASAEFKQTISVESGSDNTRTLSETSVSTLISTSMQMKVGIAVANDTNVTMGKEKTDTTTYVNLIYKF
jgi:putative salt-induced outer membrane protein